MLRLLADENFNNHILHGLRRELPDIEIARVQDWYLMNTDDRVVLEWAAENGYVVLTHDQSTAPPLAYERVGNRSVMAGVVVVSGRVPPGKVIENLVLLAYCYEPADMENNVVYLPL